MRPPPTPPGETSLSRIGYERPGLTYRGVAADARCWRCRPSCPSSPSVSRLEPPEPKRISLPSMFPPDLASPTAWATPAGSARFPEVSAASAERQRDDPQHRHHDAAALGLGADLPTSRPVRERAARTAGRGTGTAGRHWSARWGCRKGGRSWRCRSPHRCWPGSWRPSASRPDHLGMQLPGALQRWWRPGRRGRFWTVPSATSATAATTAIGQQDAHDGPNGVDPEVPDEPGAAGQTSHQRDRARRSQRHPP